MVKKKAAPMGRQLSGRLAGVVQPSLGEGWEHRDDEEDESSQGALAAVGLTTAIIADGGEIGLGSALAGQMEIISSPRGMPVSHRRGLASFAEREEYT